MVYTHLPAAAARSVFLGSLQKSQRLNLTISLPLRNQAALTEFLHQLSDPSSPNYRHYLTPAQFAEKYGPTAKDYLAVINFAKAHGLRITAVHPNRTILDVQGAVPDIENAFHVRMSNYQHPTERRKFYAPDTQPSVDLDVPILGINGLDNYALPHPRLKSQPINAKAYRLSTNAGTGPIGTYMGNDFRTAYVPDVSLTGTGQSVGLLQFDGYTASDITYYESVTGRPNVPITNILLDGFDGGPTGNGGEIEVSLDIEMTISMAPGVSNILVYEAGPTGDWHDILNRMATDNMAKQLSCSWYIPGGAADSTADQIFQQMAAQGQSFFCASGDYDAFTGLIPFPGDTPYVTEVGGTTLTTNSTGGPYGSETVWNWGNGLGSGGGISTQYSIPYWQQGVNMGNNQGSTIMRNVPDVALTADNVYVRADGEDLGEAGTSCAAPLWAAFTALVNQQAVSNSGTTVGFINPAIYAIGQGTNYTSDFHDTTVGNNFSTNSPSKFPSATGYDLCTGWGTPNGMALISALAGAPVPGISTASPLPDGVAGTAYNQTLTASGGALPYTWSLASGNLPSGLGLSGSGVISGTPTATGTATFTVQVTDRKGASSTTVFNLTIYPSGSPLITTGNPLPTGTVGAIYNDVLAASGGTTPYTWSVASGALPLGLSLTSGGIITGTPTATGTSTFTLQVTAMGGLFSTAPFSMTINPTPTPPAITTANPLFGGDVGTFYSEMLTAFGGTTPYTWSVPSGTLPPGLSLSSGGLISGIPTATGTANFTLQVTGGNGAFSTTPFSLTISPAGSLLNGSFETGNFSSWITTDFSDPFVPLQVRANGYSPGYGLFSSTATDGVDSATSGFDGNGPGTIQMAQDILVPASAPLLAFDFRAGWDMLDYGGSTLARTFTVTVQPNGGGATLLTSVQLTAQPGTKNLDTGPLSGTLNLSAYAGTHIRICFNLNVPETHTGPAFFELDNVRMLSSAPPVITSTSPLPGGTVGTAYNQTLTVSGGGSPYTWSLASGTLPAGLSLSSAGVISGTPSAVGTANFIAKVTAGNGQSDTQALSLTIAPPPPVITSSLSVPGTSGAFFSYQITATNSPTSYGATNLPTGLTLDTSSGIISGTTNWYGPNPVTISATNSGGTGSAVMTITLQLAPTITNGPPPIATFNMPYSFTYTASGYPVPVFSAAPGTLPPGLSISPLGVISGTPTATGTYPVTVYAGNNGGSAPPQSFSLLVQQAPSITNGPPPTATFNVPYNFTYTSGGYPAPSFSVNSGALPNGLSLSSAGGISGTPLATGTFTGTVVASNGAIPNATQPFSIHVLPPPPGTPVVNAEPAYSGGTSNSVSWNSVSGAVQYDVEASTSPSFATVIDSGWISATTYTFSGLLPQTAYYYRVRARNGPGPDGNWSQAVPSDFSSDVFSNASNGSTGVTLVLSGTYNSAGTVVSTPLAPSPLQAWGILSYADNVPGGTALTVDVLNSSGAVLASNVASGTDLSTLPAVANASAIELRANLSTSNSANTPTLNNWSVGYYSEGLSGWSAPVSSIQGTAPAITNGPPPATAVVNTPYNFTYASSGYPAPTFSATPGTLPPGLTLSPAGVISGMPSAPGTYTVTVDATNSISPDVTQSFPIVVLSAYQQWLAGNGLSTTIADSATPDGDGVPILIKYATGLTPGTMTVAGPAVISSTPGNNLVLQFTRVSPAPVNYIVEASPDLVGWTTIASLPAGATSWTGTASVQETGSSPVAVTLTDNTVFTPGAQRFLRLRVTTPTDIAGVFTVPQGDVPITFPGSTTTTVCPSVDNLPVDRNLVQMVTAGTITVPLAGAWGNAASPYAIRLLSGKGSGITLPISAVNGNTLTLSTQGADLTTLVAAGDTYEILPEDTLATLFGTGGGPFQTGASATSADNLDLYAPTGVLTYFNNGVNWRQAGTLTNQNNTLLSPGAGWIVVRRGTSALTFYLVGRVPEVSLQSFTAPGAYTLLGNPYPVSMSLGGTGFATASGWQAGASASGADILELYLGNNWLTFFYNGSYWRQAGTLLNDNTYSIPAGQIIYVDRKSSPSPNLSFVLLPLPYTP